MEVAGRRATDDEEEIFEDIVEECEPCKGGHVASVADGICNECEEYMCDTCFRHHLKAKQCRNHVMIDIQSLSLIETHNTAKNIQKCTRHSNEHIKFYCRTHEIVGCGECMIPDHSGCNAENIKDLAKEFELSEDFNRLKSKLERLEAANRENERKVREKDEANKAMYERFLKDIRKFRKEVNDFLDNAEECILSEVKDIKEGNDKLLTKLDLDCKLLYSTITEVAHNFDTQLYSENVLFIQTVNCKPSIQDIENTVSRIGKETKIKEYEFVPDKQLQSLLCSNNNFGKLASPITAVHNNVENIKQVEENENISIKDEPVTDYRRNTNKGKKKQKRITQRQCRGKEDFDFTTKQNTLEHVRTKEINKHFQTNRSRSELRHMENRGYGKQTFPYRDRFVSPEYSGKDEENEDYLIS